MKKNWHQIFNQTKKVSLSELKECLKNLGFKIDFKIIHVVGTNGKGSVCQILSNNLMKKELKVGTFTSPHLINVYERIKVNDLEIEPKVFALLYERIKSFKYNFFAMLYIIAMLYFQTQKCDIVILEAGIGGKLDPTATFKGEYAVLTSLGFDHLELLGHSLEKIAKQKYGLKTPKMKFYLPKNLIQFQNIFNQPNTIWVDNQGINYKIQNFKLAKTILEQSFQIKNVEFKDVKGRTDYFINNNKLTIFDVAHNESGIKASLNYLKTQNLSFQTVLICLNKTKESSDLKHLFKNYQVYYYQPNENFHNFNDLKWKKIKNLKSFFSSQNKNTLYLGSFKLIGPLYEIKEMIIYD